MDYERYGLKPGVYEQINCVLETSLEEEPQVQEPSLFKEILRSLTLTCIQEGPSIVRTIMATREFRAGVIVGGLSAGMGFLSGADSVTMGSIGVMGGWFIGNTYFMVEGSITGLRSFLSNSFRSRS